MADHIFSYGPQGRSVIVDDDGRLLTNGDPTASGYVYAFGPQGYAVAVDEDGRLLVNVVNVSGVGGNGATQYLYGDSDGNYGIGDTLFPNITPTAGLNNIALGDDALEGLTTGDYNVALGKNAGAAVTTNSGSVSIGRRAHYIGAGTRSIAIGYYAGYNGSGVENIAIGPYTGQNQTPSCSQNVAIGYECMMNNTEKAMDDCIAIGAGALDSPDADVKDCIGIGRSAMNSPSGNDCIAIGRSSAKNVDGATQSIYIGYLTSSHDMPTNTIVIGASATASGDNTMRLGSPEVQVQCEDLMVQQRVLAASGEFRNGIKVGDGTFHIDGDDIIGPECAIYLNKGIKNVAVGSNAALNLTGNNNIAVGYQAGYQADGNTNLFCGYWAGYSADGHGNVILGEYAAAQTFETYNYAIAIGRYAAFGTLSDYTIAIGGNALQNPAYSPIGVENIAIGKECMSNAASGAAYNVAIGTQALEDVAINSNKHVAIGYQAGDFNAVSGIGNTLIGAHSNVDNAAVEYATAIGYNAIASGSNQIRIGQPADVVHCENLMVQNTITAASGNFRNGAVMGTEAGFEGTALQINTSSAQDAAQITSDGGATALELVANSSSGTDPVLSIVNNGDGDDIDGSNWSISNNGSGQFENLNTNTITPRSFNVEEGASSDTAFDFSTGMITRIGLESSITVSGINGVPGQRHILQLFHDSGGNEVTWGSNVSWPSGQAPQLGDEANRVDIFEFIYFNDNTMTNKYVGVWSALNVTNI
jgi:hypothetical protein